MTVLKFVSRTWSQSRTLISKETLLTEVSTFWACLDLQFIRQYHHNLTNQYPNNLTLKVASTRVVNFTNSKVFLFRFYGSQTLQVPILNLYLSYVAVKGA